MWTDNIFTGTMCYSFLVGRKSLNVCFPPIEALGGRSALLLLNVLLGILTRSPHVSVPAWLSVRLGSFKPIRCLQNASSHNDDVRAFVVDHLLRGCVLLAQQISWKKRKDRWIRKFVNEEGKWIKCRTTAPPCVGLCHYSSHFMVAQIKMKASLFTAN